MNQHPNQPNNPLNNPQLQGLTQLQQSTIQQLPPTSLPLGSNLTINSKIPNITIANPLQQGITTAVPNTSLNPSSQLSQLNQHNQLPFSTTLGSTSLPQIKQNALLSNLAINSLNTSQIGNNINISNTTNPSNSANTIINSSQNPLLQSYGKLPQLSNTNNSNTAVNTMNTANQVVPSSQLTQNTALNANNFTNIQRQLPNNNIILNQMNQTATNSNNNTNNTIQNPPSLLLQQQPTTTILPQHSNTQSNQQQQQQSIQSMTNNTRNVITQNTQNQPTIASTQQSNIPNMLYQGTYTTSNNPINSTNDRGGLQSNQNFMELLNNTHNMDQISSPQHQQMGTNSNLHHGIVTSHSGHLQAINPQTQGHSSSHHHSHSASPVHVNNNNNNNRFNTNSANQNQNQGIGHANLIQNNQQNQQNQQNNQQNNQNNSNNNANMTPNLPPLSHQHQIDQSQVQPSSSRNSYTQTQSASTQHSVMSTPAPKQRQQQQQQHSTPQIASPPPPTTVSIPQTQIQPQQPPVVVVSEPYVDSDGNITRCICNENFRQVEFMIFCEGCEVWQHCECMGIQEGSEPPDYFCEQCRPDDPIHVNRKLNGPIVRPQPKQRRPRQRAAAAATATATNTNTTNNNEQNTNNNNNNIVDSNSTVNAPPAPTTGRRTKKQIEGAAAAAAAATMASNTQQNASVPTETTSSSTTKRGKNVNTDQGSTTSGRRGGGGAAGSGGATGGVNNGPNIGVGNNDNNKPVQTTYINTTPVPAPIPPQQKAKPLSIAEPHREYQANTAQIYPTVDNELIALKIQQSDSLYAFLTNPILYTWPNLPPPDQLFDINNPSLILIDTHTQQFITELCQLHLQHSQTPQIHFITPDFIQYIYVNYRSIAAWASVQLKVPLMQFSELLFLRRICPYLTLEQLSSVLQHYTGQIPQELLSEYKAYQLTIAEQQKQQLESQNGIQFTQANLQNSGQILANYGNLDLQSTDMTDDNIVNQMIAHDALRHQQNQLILQHLHSQSTESGPNLLTNLQQLIDNGINIDENQLIAAGVLLRDINGNLTLADLNTHDEQTIMSPDSQQTPNTSRPRTATGRTKKDEKNDKNEKNLQKDEKKNNTTSEKTTATGGRRNAKSSVQKVPRGSTSTDLGLTPGQVLMSPDMALEAHLMTQNNNVNSQHPQALFSNPNTTTLLPNPQHAHGPYPGIDSRDQGQVLQQRDNYTQMNTALGLAQENIINQAIQQNDIIQSSKYAQNLEHEQCNDVLTAMLRSPAGNKHITETTIIGPDGTTTTTTTTTITTTTVLATPVDDILPPSMQNESGNVHEDECEQEEGVVIAENKVSKRSKGTRGTPVGVGGSKRSRGGAAAANIATSVINDDGSIVAIPPTTTKRRRFGRGGGGDGEGRVAMVRGDKNTKIESIIGASNTPLNYLVGIINTEPFNNVKQSKWNGWVGNVWRQLGIVEGDEGKNQNKDGKFEFDETEEEKLKNQENEKNDEKKSNLIKTPLGRKFTLQDIPINAKIRTKLTTIGRQMARLLSRRDGGGAGSGMVNPLGHPVRANSLTQNRPIPPQPPICPIPGLHTAFYPRSITKLPLNGHKVYVPPPIAAIDQRLVDKRLVEDKNKNYLFGHESVLSTIIYPEWQQKQLELQWSGGTQSYIDDVMKQYQLGHDISGENDQNDKNNTKNDKNNAKINKHFSISSNNDRIVVLMMLFDAFTHLDFNDIGNNTISSNYNDKKGQNLYLKPILKFFTPQLKDRLLTKLGLNQIDNEILTTKVSTTTSTARGKRDKGDKHDTNNNESKNIHSIDSISSINQSNPSNQTLPTSLASTILKSDIFAKLFHRFCQFAETHPHNYHTYSPPSPFSPTQSDSHPQNSNITNFVHDYSNNNMQFGDLEGFFDALFTPFNHNYSSIGLFGHRNNNNSQNTVSSYNTTGIGLNNAFYSLYSRQNSADNKITDVFHSRLALQRLEFEQLISELIHSRQFETFFSTKIDNFFNFKNTQTDNFKNTQTENIKSTTKKGTSSSSSSSYTSGTMTSTHNNNSKSRSIASALVNSDKFLEKINLTSTFNLHPSFLSSFPFNNRIYSTIQLPNYLSEHVFDKNSKDGGSLATLLVSTLSKSRRSSLLSPQTETLSLDDTDQSQQSLGRGRRGGSTVKAKRGGVQSTTKGARGGRNVTNDDDNTRNTMCDDDNDIDDVSKSRMVANLEAKREEYLLQNEKEKIILTVFRFLRGIIFAKLCVLYEFFVEILHTQHNSLFLPHSKKTPLVSCDKNKINDGGMGDDEYSGGTSAIIDAKGTKKLHQSESFISPYIHTPLSLSEALLSNNSNQHLYGAYSSLPSNISNYVSGLVSPAQQLDIIKKTTKTQNNTKKPHFAQYNINGGRNGPIGTVRGSKTPLQSTFIRNYGHIKNDFILEFENNNDESIDNDLKFDPKHAENNNDKIITTAGGRVIDLDNITFSTQKYLRNNNKNSENSKNDQISSSNQQYQSKLHTVTDTLYRNNPPRVIVGKKFHQFNHQYTNNIIDKYKQHHKDQLNELRRIIQTDDVTNYDGDMIGGDDNNNNHNTNNKGNKTNNNNSKSNFTSITPAKLNTDTTKTPTTTTNSNNKASKLTTPSTSTTTTTQSIPTTAVTNTTNATTTAAPVITTVQSNTPSSSSSTQQQQQQPQEEHFVDPLQPARATKRPLPPVNAADNDDGDDNNNQDGIGNKSETLSSSSTTTITTMDEQQMSSSDQNNTNDIDVDAERESNVKKVRLNNNNTNNTNTPVVVENETEKEIINETVNMMNNIDTSITAPTNGVVVANIDDVSLGDSTANDKSNTDNVPSDTVAIADDDTLVQLGTNMGLETTTTPTTTKTTNVDVVDSIENNNNNPADTTATIVDTKSSDNAINVDITDKNDNITPPTTAITEKDAQTISQDASVGENDRAIIEPVTVVTDSTMANDEDTITKMVVDEPVEEMAVLVENVVPTTAPIETNNENTTHTDVENTTSDVIVIEDIHKTQTIVE